MGTPLFTEVILTLLFIVYSHRCNSEQAGGNVPPIFFYPRIDFWLLRRVVNKNNEIRVGERGTSV